MKIYKYSQANNQNITILPCGYLCMHFCDYTSKHISVYHLNVLFNFSCVSC